jgi:uroporphyrinogen decarboxylase
MITHRERLQACLNGEAPDRSPVALWRHFPVDDQTPDKLAAATINFQRAYDWDLIKVTPASSFCLRDWGSEDIWQGDPEGTRHFTRRMINAPADWERLPILDPRRGFLADQIQCLKLIRREYDSSTPLLQTIFSPLAQAKNLIGGDALIVHIRQYPSAVMKGLHTIAESTLLFAEACLDAGIDGIFYAVQHAQAGLLTQTEFAMYGKLMDTRVLSAAKHLPFNMAHLHGENIYFDSLTDYPVSILNWHDRETPPSLAEAQQKFKGVVCGGLKRETVTLEDSSAIEREARAAVESTQGRRFILGTGCVVPIIAPHGNLLAARKSVEAK